MPNYANLVQIKIEPFVIRYDTAGLWRFVSRILAWIEAYQVFKLDPTEDPWYGKLAGVVFPRWYSAFKIARLVPNPGPAHTVGKILIPVHYAAFQLCKLKNGPQRKWYQTALAIIFPRIYGIYASIALNKGKSSSVNTTLLQPLLNTTLQKTTWNIPQIQLQGGPAAQPPPVSLGYTPSNYQNMQPVISNYRVPITPY